MRRAIVWLLGLFSTALLFAEKPPVAPKPLFRDPIYDGAADPVVIWNPHAQRWWMFYTNRRANMPGLSGVAWVHGCRIGIAESADGAQWNYLGTAEFDLPPEIGGTEPTYWAPDVLTAPDGTHHMFLTVVPGVFENWNHPRHIVHLTSSDLRKWHYESKLQLASDRVIDAVVHRLPDGTWRMWYNNERDGKSIYYADSPDLKTWSDRGRCEGVAGRCEGPYVFEWKGRTWMLVDTWRGLGAYSSDDFLHWKSQPELLLATPGKGTDDGVNGGHPGVIVSSDRAYVFYFTHPGRAGTIKPEDKDSLELRRSSIQVAELIEKDGTLTCDRDAPAHIALPPPPDTGTSWAFPKFGTVKRTELRARDGCVYVDPATKTYTLYFSGRGPNRRAAVVAYTSKDLENWTGPTVVFERPADWWADRNIWAPEMHAYNGKFYLFLTFDSTHLLPEQWRDWLPRVKRGSQILVSDSPMGPFAPFANRSTLPEDMMTLDGTLWVEDGVPYMVFCHEWVQIKDGTVEMIRLKDDLSGTIGEPRRLFHGSDAPWSRKSEQHGEHVTDGAWLYKTQGGKLLILWSSFTSTGYAVGIATSDSGKLAGPWRQSPEPLFAADGGHPMLFRRLDGQLMLALHQPNQTPQEREQFLEIDEVNDTLVLKRR